jgi:hypothetical protein
MAIGFSECLPSCPGSEFGRTLPLHCTLRPWLTYAALGLTVKPFCARSAESPNALPRLGWSMAEILANWIAKLAWLGV